jgi:four helix bundle protein
MTHGRVGNHRDLVAWQYSIDLVVSVYRHTQKLPSHERFGLMSQMRRAAVSVPANIAEGAARGSTAEFARFTLIAQGSLAELETYLDILERLDYSSQCAELRNQVNSLRRMINGLHRALVSKR